MNQEKAKALREKWKKQVDPGICEHPYLELEKSERGYLTGRYHCLYCGDDVPRQGAGMEGESSGADELPPSDPLPC